MSPFPLYTIMPNSMSFAEIATRAVEKNQLIITNGRAILLAPRVLQGYKNIPIAERYRIC